MDPMTLNVGLEMAMELGEHWLSPITARLMARYPDMSPGDAARYDELCRRAMTFGHRQIAAALEADRKGGERARQMFRARVLAEHPWTDESNLGRLYSQACYYAYKDGWRGE